MNTIGRWLTSLLAVLIIVSILWWLKTIHHDNLTPASMYIFTVQSDTPEPIKLDNVSYSSNLNDEIRKGKRFAYLVNGKTRKDVNGLHESEDRDIFWLTYKAGDTSGHINVPNSTWGSGRNYILDYAIEQAKQRSDGGYLYYVMIDDDVLLQTRSEPGVNWKPWEEMKSDPYERFEDFLLEYEPAVGYSRYDDPYRQHEELDKPMNIGWDFDLLFNAYHRDTLSFLLPYEITFEKESWYNSPWISKQLISMLYNTHRLQCNSVYVINKESHKQKEPSERGNLYKDAKKFDAPRDYILNALLPMTKTDPSVKNHLIDAVLKGKGIRNMQIKYAPGVGKKKGNTSYIVTDTFISTFWDKNHPFIQSRLKARAKVADLLKLKESEKLEFVPDPVYSLPTARLSLNLPTT